MFPQYLTVIMFMWKFQSGTNIIGPIAAKESTLKERRNICLYPAQAYQTKVYLFISTVCYQVGRFGQSALRIWCSNFDKIFIISHTYTYSRPLPFSSYPLIFFPIYLSIYFLAQR